MVKKTKTSTILYFDDEEDIRNFAYTVLELEGYHCLQADTFEEAFQLLKEKKIDLVIMDFKLEEPDRWVIIDIIRGKPATSEIPVIVCTTSSEESLKRHALNSRITDFLVKPLSADSLRKAVSRVTSSLGWITRFKTYPVVPGRYL